MKINSNQPPATPSTGDASSVIRPLYGGAISSDTQRFRSSIGGTVGEIKTALANGSLTGTDKTEAQKALTQLNKALSSLPVTGLDTTGTPSSVGGGGSGGSMTGVPGRALYGVFIKSNIANFKSEIQSTIKDINAAINNGQLSGQDLTSAKQARTDLKKAAADLE